MDSVVVSGSTRRFVLMVVGLLVLAAVFTVGYAYYAFWWSETPQDLFTDLKYFVGMVIAYATPSMPEPLV